jgi:hypothetical protein
MVRSPAMLHDHEAHSAGCVRCCRRFCEPEYHNVRDAVRTAALQAVMAQGAMVPGSPHLRALQLLRNHAALARSMANREEDEYMARSESHRQDFFPAKHLYTT